MKVPIIDLRVQYLALKEEIDTAIQSVIDETAFVRGRHVEQFEQAFAEACGVKQCISVGNGTDAILIVLKMLGIGPGDEVITTANSFFATSETISLAGATPVFVDTDEYFCIDVEKIEEKITKRTKAVLPVHLYGQSVQIAKIQDLCRKHRLVLVEDCAQAHFAEFEGQKVGTFGIAGTFSFYPAKNMGAFGDGGAIVTNDDTLAMKMRMFADHGLKPIHRIEGMNSRLDGLQAAVLSVKLSHVLDWNRRRADHAACYTHALKSVDGIETPRVRKDCRHVYHQYVVRTSMRDELAQHLEVHGIVTGLQSSTALPLLPVYSHLNYAKEDIPAAARDQDEILSLPMYPELDREQIEHVVGRIKEFFDASPA